MTAYGVMVFTLAFMLVLYTIERALIWVERWAGALARYHERGLERLERHDSRRWLAELGRIVDRPSSRL